MSLIPKYKHIINIIVTCLSTSHEWIACVSSRARAYGVVINDFTFSSVTTTAQTRIYTFLVITCFIQRTLSTDCAFWMTGRWSTDKCGQARAYWLVGYWSTLTIRSTRTWVTGFDIYNCK